MIAMFRSPVFRGVLAAVIIISLIVGWRLWSDARRERRIEFNERAAGAKLKWIATAETEIRYEDKDKNGVNDFWTGDVTGLHRHGKLIDADVAQADARPLNALVPEPVPHHGYLLVAMEADDSEKPPVSLRQATDPKSGKVHHPDRYAFCAYPAEFDSTGRATFIMNEGITVYKILNDGQPILRWPSNADLRSLYKRLD